MRGKKGRPHWDPADPPRRRANERRGHGTSATDRPPVAGGIGRETGQVRPAALDSTTAEELREFVGRFAGGAAPLYTGARGGYRWVAGSGRGHATAGHTPGGREGARGGDGGGIREVHNNTCEGLWAARRPFLRPSRGASKWRLDEYVSIFQWIHNITAVSTEFLRALFGLNPRLTTNYGP